MCGNRKPWRSGNRKPRVTIESHVCQQKAMRSNRKPCVATENQKADCCSKEPFATKEAMCGNRKPCVATESHTWPQKVVGGDRKPLVAKESHGWQQKAAMCGNRKPGKCY